MNELANEDIRNKLIAEVDVATIKRAANLSARGLQDADIAKLLMITDLQVAAIKFSQIYIEKYAEDARKMIDAAFDRSDAWDLLEEKSLEVLLETFKFNRDPKFALMAARVSNTAERRGKTKQEPPKVIEPGQGTGTTNIIILNVNKAFVTKSSEAGNMIDVTPRQDKIPLKQSDTPPFRLVDEILAPVKDKNAVGRRDQMDEVQRMFENSGVVFDKE